MFRALRLSGVATRPVPSRRGRDGNVLGLLRRRPASAVPMENRAGAPNRPDVRSAGAPDLVQGLARSARNAGPGLAVPVKNGPVSPHRPDIARAAAPYAKQVNVRL